MNKQIRLALLLALLPVSAALADAEVGTGTLLLAAGDDDPTPVAAPLLSSEVQIDIVAMTARVKVGQRFRNPGTRWAEGIYVFPLPENAAVDHLRLRIGERLVEGEVQERDQARQRYEQARAAGQRTSLVEQQRPNIFTTSVANIDPGGEVRVEIEYQQPARWRDGSFSLRFPMVVGPRYIPGEPIREQLRVLGGWSPDTDQVPDASRITPPVRRPEKGSANPVSLVIDLKPGMPLAELTSHYHPVRIEQIGDSGNPRFHIGLAEGPVPADRDFELVWRPEPGHAPRAALFTESQGDYTYALLMLTPPGAEALEAQRSARDLSFVIDTSGSMHGASIEQARKAVIHALRRLQADDRFNVIAFADSARRLFPELAEASPEHVARALAWVDGLRANGGTEMAAALDLALPTGRRTDARLHQVVFLTDGAVGNEAALFRLIRRRLGHSRLFPVGIGSAPNGHFMRGAAEFGRGSFTHIGAPAEVLEKMDALLRRLEYPALTGLHLDLPEAGETDVYPDPLPDLYLGEPIQVALRLTRLPDSLAVSGRFGNRPWQASLDLDSPLPGDGIRLLWARRRIAALMNDLHQASEDAAERAGLREQVVETALEHHVVSPFTSLVAVDKTPARPNGEGLDSHHLATNLPHGWSYGKVFGMAQGATPATGLILLGLGLLPLAAVLGLLGRSSGRGASR
jgi:Ca-activated chloride channel family protein